MRIIGGSLAGRKLLGPKDLRIRPSSDRLRESLFNILTSWQGEFFSGKKVLDLFAGTGAFGCEALSRGAREVLFIEQDRQACRLIARNLSALKLQQQAKIICYDAVKFCQKLRGESSFYSFDIIFADPPYGKALGGQAFRQILASKAYHKGSIFILEESKNSPAEQFAPLSLYKSRIYSVSALYIYEMPFEQA